MVKKITLMHTLVSGLLLIWNEGMGMSLPRNSFWHVGARWDGKDDVLCLMEKYEVAFWCNRVRKVGDASRLKEWDYVAITEPDSHRVRYIARAASRAIPLTKFGLKCFDRYADSTAFRLREMLDVTQHQINVVKTGRFYAIRDVCLQRQIEEAHGKCSLVCFLSRNDSDSAEVAKAKQVLAKARIGQSKFRKALEGVWDGRCAVTGECQQELLRASHIKPWSVSSSKECTDANNGFLLSAEMDALFDSGLITFRNDGELICSQTLGVETIARLKLQSARITKDLNSRQREYLEYHRVNVFKK